MCCKENNNASSIGDILSVIVVLQQNACVGSTLDSCDRPMLGGGPSCLACNTRPVMLYTCSGNGTPWSMPITKDATTNCEETSEGCSTVFKVEKVEGDVATFRCLQPNTDETSLYPYINTNSVFSMSLGCLCAIRCLSDTYVECL